MEIFTAEHVFPIASPPLADGAVAVEDGRIVSVGPRAEVVQAAVGDGVVVHDLGRSAILPGLVNAHTHLELSWMADTGLPRGDYVAWLRALLALRPTTDADAARPAAETAIATMVARGTVAVGDVGNEGWLAPLLARSPLRAVVFHELYGLDASRAERTVQDAVERLEEVARDPDVVAASRRLCLALTPHAPHTTSLALLRALAGRAAASREPLSIHVAESEEEVEWMTEGTGPLRDLFLERGLVAPDRPPAGRSPVEHLKRAGVLSATTMAVHCVHLDQPDHSSLQAARATVVACPRSNAALGVGTAPVPALMREGIPVALGTDSLASAPDLDLFGEMRALREDHPELSPAAVLRMATLNGARALGLGNDLGSIEAGKLAELIVVPVPEDAGQPLEALCAGPEKVYRLDDAVRQLAGTGP